jgi:hypothetical protein
MNICIDCHWCIDKGDMRYFCTSNPALAVDCRVKNIDGKCSDYSKKQRISMPKPEEIIAACNTTAETVSEIKRMLEPPTEAGRLLELATIRDGLKRALEKAQADLDANTFEIAGLIPGPDVGSKSKKVSEDLKVTVKRELIFKPDVDKIREVCASNSSGKSVLFPPIKSKTVVELDEKGYKWYEANNPEIFRLIAEHVSAKPAKVYVEVKPVKKK